MASIRYALSQPAVPRGTKWKNRRDRTASIRRVHCSSYLHLNTGDAKSAPLYALPLLNAQPPAPERIAEVDLHERIDRLQKGLRLACEPPEAARIQGAVDDLEQEFNSLQRQFALDQEDYYSRPVTERVGGNRQLDAEQQQIQALQAEIQNLKEQLAALTSPQQPR